MAASELVTNSDEAINAFSEMTSSDRNEYLNLMQKLKSLEESGNSKISKEDLDKAMSDFVKEKEDFQAV